MISDQLVQLVCFKSDFIRNLEGHVCGQDDWVSGMFATITTLTLLFAYSQTFHFFFIGKFHELGQKHECRTQTHIDPVFLAVDRIRNEEQKKCKLDFYTAEMHRKNHG